MKQPPLARSLFHACQGLAYVMRTQRNARIHVVAAGLVIAAAAWLQLEVVRWCLLLFAIGGIWTAEALNTACEAVVDLLAPEYHERAKVAKDVSAGAVLILSLTAAVIGVLLLGPPLWERLRPLLAP